MKLILMIALINGCAIIFEDDISEEVVYVIMPADGSQSIIQDQLFWWETIEGALKYNLQIVEGSFFAPISFVSDTNIAGDKFMVNLSPGDYEWRILGWNNYSETDFFYSSLVIEDTTKAR